MAAGEISAAELMAAVEQWERAIAVETTEWAKSVQERMRADARWTDRNGPSVTGLNARQSLQTEVEYTPGVEVWAVAMSDRESPRQWNGGPAPVGAFLEKGTKWMGPYDVIYPTLTAAVPDLQDRVRRVLAPDM